MLELDLTEHEREVLVEILESAHSDLRMEIANTDLKDFRDMLKGRKAVLAKVLDALREPRAV
jgi:hypothetical protein